MFQLVIWVRTCNLPIGFPPILAAARSFIYRVKDRNPNMEACIDMGMIFGMALLVQLFTWLVITGAGQNECTVTRCKDDGPIIRFPFRTKDQPEHCGYPGFHLYCDDTCYKETVLEFQQQANTSLRGLQLSISRKACVLSIDYTRQQMHVSVYYREVKPQLLNPQNSSPFKVEQVTSNDNLYFSTRVKYTYDWYYAEFTVLNCSFTTDSYTALLDYTFITSLDGRTVLGELYVISSGIKTFEAPLKYCTKMYNASLSPHDAYGIYDAVLTWDAPNCSYCEAKGQYCKLKNNNSSTGEATTTVCFPIPRGHGPPHKAILAGKIGGVFFILLLLVALYYVIKTYKQKKGDQLKIEMFLADYKALKPTRYSYADIRKITNQFKEKVGQGGYGSVFKGQLSSDVLVAVKVLNDADSKGNGEEFINEVSTMGQIHHVNVVRLVGYCADGSSRALVYEFLPNNSLEKFVCSGANHSNRFLGWEKLQKIALGIAKGIEYLHQGCAQKILHFDIKPHNILLDQNFNPKISDFGLAKLCSKGQSIVSMTMARGTIGYIAPEVFSRNFGKVSSKSDVYSFGMLLLEIVGSRNNTAAVGTENSDETYFPEWIFHRLEQGGELTIQIENEVDNNIARKLTIVGLWCIGWHPVDRPSMKHVIQMLEGEDCPAIPPNPFSSTSSRNATAITHAKPFTQELEAISESE